MNTKICAVILVLMGTLALYVGISGWVVADFEARMEKQLREHKDAAKGVIYQGVSFKSVAAARQAAEEDKIAQYFRWVYQVPPGLPFLLTALAFGFVGGIADILYKLAGSEEVPPAMMLFKPLFGGIVGLMVFGVSTTMPKLIVESADGVRPLTQIFLCLFSGAFSHHVYLWVEEKTKSVFPLGTPPSPPPLPAPSPQSPPPPAPIPGPGAAISLPASKD